MEVDRSELMLGYVEPYYRESRFYTAQNNAKGQEFNILHAIVEELPNQFNPQTATWGLRLWEELLDIDRGENDLEGRRGQVLLKMVASQMMTPITLERLLKSITKTEVIVTNNVAPYTFSVDISTDTNVPVNYSNIIKVLEEVKPAHLAYDAFFSANVGVSVSVETLAVAKWPLLAGEHVTGVLPDTLWTARVSHGNVMASGAGEGIRVEYDISGTKPDTNILAAGGGMLINEVVQTSHEKIGFCLSGENLTGILPDENYLFKSLEAVVDSSADGESCKAVYRQTGAEIAGLLPERQYSAGYQETEIRNQPEGSGKLVKHELSGEGIDMGRVDKRGIDTEVSGEGVRVIYPLCGEDI